MATLNDKTYHVEEVCEVINGSTFVPDMFLYRDGSMWACGRCFLRTMVCFETLACMRANNEPSQVEHGGWEYRKDPQETLKPLSDFCRTCVELRADLPNGILTRSSDM